MMREYENIEIETTMSTPPIHRTSPYQFELTAQPGQHVITCGRIVSGTSSVTTLAAPGFVLRHPAGVPPLESWVPVAPAGTPQAPRLFDPKGLHDVDQ